MKELLISQRYYEEKNKLNPKNQSESIDLQYGAFLNVQEFGGGGGSRIWHWSFKTFFFDHFFFDNAVPTPKIIKIFITSLVIDRHTDKWVHTKA